MITEDLDIFFADFTESWTVGGNVLLAHFYQGGEEDDGIEGYVPEIVVKTADLPAPIAHGTAATRAADGSVYKVQGIQPESTKATTKLILEYVSG